MRVRYFTAAELVETLYRGLADNSVGRVIDQTLRADVVIVDEVGFAPLDDAGAQLLFRFVAAAYERVPIGIGSHWPFDEWGRFLPEHTTAVSMLDRLLHHSVVVRHRRRVVPHERSAPAIGRGEVTARSTTDEDDREGGERQHLNSPRRCVQPDRTGWPRRRHRRSESRKNTAIVKAERQEGWVLLLATSGYHKLAVDRSP